MKKAGNWGGDSRRREFCNLAGTPFLSLFKHLKVEEGTAE